MVIKIVAPDDRQEFKQLLKQQSGKTIIIKCYADWCKPCTRIADDVSKLVEQLSDDYIFMSLNIDDDDDVASYLKVRKLPTFLSYVKGEPMYSYMGADINEVKKFLQKLQAGNSFNF